MQPQHGQVQRELPHNEKGGQEKAPSRSQSGGGGGRTFLRLLNRAFKGTAAHRTVITNAEEEEEEETGGDQGATHKYADGGDGDGDNITNEEQETGGEEAEGGDGDEDNIINEEEEGDQIGGEEGEGGDGGWDNNSNEEADQNQEKTRKGKGFPTPEEDSISLDRAFKGSGCDVCKIVEILSKEDAAHCKLIQQCYKKTYGEELIKRLSSELEKDTTVSAHLSLTRAFSLWVLDAAERDATIVREGMRMGSLDLEAVTEVICSRTPAQLRSLKKAYISLYRSPLPDDINKSILLFVGTGSLRSHKQLLIACLDDERDKGTNVTVNMVEDDAKQLYKDGNQIWGKQLYEDGYQIWATNERTIIDIFTQRKRNGPHLAAVNAQYNALYGHFLERAMEKETSRYFLKGLLILLKCANNSAKFFAEVLHEAMEGVGTSYAKLIRVVVTRADIDIEDIKKEYYLAYKESLKDAIHKNTSAHYREFLINLLYRSTGLPIPTHEEDSISLNSAFKGFPTPEEDSISLNRAFKGKGCDVGKIVEILSNRDSPHIEDIKKHYLKAYGEELSLRLSSELSSLGKGDIKEKFGFDLALSTTLSLKFSNGLKIHTHIQRALSLWILDEAERDATIVRQGMSVASLDLEAVTEVICSRTPSQLRSLKQAYFSLYSSLLLDDITKSTFRFYGWHKELLIACLDDQKQKRDDGPDVDLKLAEVDAKQLYQDGENRWGTNEKTFVDIFTKSKRPYLAEVDAAYNKLYGHSLEKAVVVETSGYFRDGLLILLSCAKNSAKYFAEVLHKAMEGTGTSDTKLIRVVVTRANIDMEVIKNEYYLAYRESLKGAIHKNTSGHYRTFLLNLVDRSKGA